METPSPAANILACNNLVMEAATLVTILKGNYIRVGKCIYVATLQASIAVPATPTEDAQVRA